jgi:hypothetical protein
MLHKGEIKFDLVFASRNGTKWGQRNSLRSLYLLQKRLGLPASGWHSLRHTMAHNRLTGPRKKLT